MQAILFLHRQDTTGKILPSGDANANSPIVGGIASKIVQNIMR